MTAAGTVRDLVALVADNDMNAAIDALLERHKALGIRPLRWKVFVHPDHDPGCLLRAHDFLRSQCARFAHALVVLDRDGCGSQESAESLERQLDTRLRGSGWNDRACTVVIDPELEAWVWSDSPHVDRALGWVDPLHPLKDHLIAERLWDHASPKPTDPKAAMEIALRIARKPRSSAIFSALASTVSFNRCRDRAFRKLRSILVGWFGESPPATAGPPPERTT